MAEDKLAFIREDTDQLRESGLYNNIRTMDSPADAWMVVDGQRVLNFCTNNYLGLANHPRLKEAAQAAIDRWGVGPAAVRSIAGTQATARGAGAPAGCVQGRRRRPLRAERLLRQPGGHRTAGRQGRRDLLRPAEPRQHHRRRPSERRQDRGLRALQPGRCRGQDPREPAQFPARPVDQRWRLQHGRRHCAAG